MNKEKANKILTNEEGSGLVLSLMVLLVLSVLGAALGVVTIGSYRLADNTQDSNSAYYIAEAGANMAYEELKNGVMDAYEASETADTFYNTEIGFKGIVNNVNGDEYGDEIFSSQNGDQPTATISIDGPRGEGAEREYTIKSVGEVAGKKRIVNKDISIHWIEKDGLPLQLVPSGAAINVLDALKVPKNVDKNDKVLVNEAILYGQDVKSEDLDESMFSNEDVQIKQGDTTWENNLNNLKEQYPTMFENYLIEKSELLSLNEGGGITDQNAEEYKGNIVRQKEDIKIRDRIVIKGNIVAKEGSVNLGTDVTVEGSIILGKGHFSSGDRLNVTGDIVTKKGKVDLGTDTTIDGSIISNENKIGVRDRLVVNGDILSGKDKIELGTDSTVNGSVISLSDKVTVGDRFTLNGPLVSFKGKIEIPNDSIVNGIIIGHNIELGHRVKVKYSDNYTDSFPFNNNIENTNLNPSIDELISSSPAIEP